jgi:hypothetical protein
VRTLVGGVPHVGNASPLLGFAALPALYGVLSPGGEARYSIRLLRVSGVISVWSGVDGVPKPSRQLLNVEAIVGQMLRKGDNT